MKQTETKFIHFYFLLSCMVFLMLTLGVFPYPAFAASHSSFPLVQENIKIQGTVYSNNESLPGVSITADGKSIGITNLNGQFSITVKRGTDLKFSLIGYTPFSITVNEDNPNLRITLAEATTDLNEVVVTALGIKREEKALGYATKQVKGEQLTEALSNNWTDALSGKVAGLNLVRSNGGPAGSNKIILRGENNFSGETAALIVVDGVVINNSSGKMTGSGSGAYLSEDSPVDFGTGLNDINPEDIESVQVLKGPGAAALYGQRGANGAIIITTKSGSKKKGLGVTVNSNAAIESISRWPDYQYEYGQGTNGANYYSYNDSEDGASTRSTSDAWGPKFDGQEYYQYDPITHTKGTTRTPWVPYPNARKQFFDAGRTFTNSVTLDGGSDKTSIRFSATNVQNKWIIPNTGYNRTSIALSASQKVSDKLSINAKVNYNKKGSDNLPNTGYNNQSFMYWNIFWEPNADINWLKDYWMPGQEGLKQSYPFSSYPDNPYLIAYEMLNKSDRDGITGNVQATYNFTKEFSLMVRTSMDMNNERRSQQRPYDTEKFKKGMYRTQNIFAQEMSADFLAKYEKQLNKDIDVSISAGGSHLKNTYNRDYNKADSLLYPGVYTLANSAGIIISEPYRSSYVLNSFYGLATFAYKDYFFVDVTGRNDWTSILATPTSTRNVSFFYPSVNTSFLLSEAIDLPKAISYAKIRGSISGVGSGLTGAYLTSYVYAPELVIPGGQSNPSQMPNEDLKPLFTTSYEIGTDLKFLENRLSLGLTLYTANTTNQILSATTDRSSGYSSVVVNSGLIQNKGIEIEASSDVLKNREGFNWNIYGTFTANKNIVKELTPELSSLTLQNGPGSRGAIIATIGGSMGDLYGRGYERAPDGQIIYQDGYPVIGEDMKYIGNTNPKWRASIGNEFRYKQFKFSFLIDGQYGAVGYSLTAANMAEQGKTTNTLPGRYNGIIGNGVMRAADGSYVPNDVIATDVRNYYVLHYGKDNVEGTTYSTDFVKLREARIDYTLSPSIAQKLHVQRVAIGLYGRDLFTWTKWPVFDPEFGTLGNGDINKGFELGQFPSTRTFGMNLIVGF
ncbi:SusC/RagA family TonB-linked outer membrane protein [Olivibacter ginsenosidimutans]|uniref:SusC/RagA family TonB-linked outer membrane protein n=1 Tax=Olivibacter ginsenosidimutans TaxID=1176537 RepID=A0ABP9C8W0_9SPHI